MSGESDPDFDAMNVKELKAFIVKAGLSHADCSEKHELRSRASRAAADLKLKAEQRDEDVKGSKRAGAKPEETNGLRRRSQGSDRNAAPSDERAMSTKVANLVAESGQVVSGRDASAILADVDEFKKIIEEGSFSEEGAKKMLADLEGVRSSLSFENALEQKCGRVIQLVLMAVSLVPMLLTSFESCYEFATRPELVEVPADLSGMHAVVTGGSGAVGLDLAIMLANSGAQVVISCHGREVCESAESDQIESRLAAMGLLRDESASDGSNPQQGWIDVWPLQLESFTSVREFAARIAKQWDAVDILVHNAATKDGCTRTEDGFEHVTQVNYLSPFLLTQLLLPTLRTDSARVIHVTCDAGLQQTDWLPWPLRRTSPELLPKIHWEGLKQREEGTSGNTITGACSSLVEYANSKLAVVVHARELNKELSRLNRGVAHVVNPGSMDSKFGRSDSVPAAKPSMQSSMMSRLPPVWIANMVYQHTFGKMFSGIGARMYRPTSQGAKAIFHVATSPALGYEEHGGGLFSDTYGAFSDCGKAPEDCGRVPLSRQPTATTDEELATELWTYTEQVLQEGVEE